LVKVLQHSVHKLGLFFLKLLLNQNKMDGKSKQIVFTGSINTIRIYIICLQLLYAAQCEGCRSYLYIDTSGFTNKMGFSKSQSRHKPSIREKMLVVLKTH